MPYDYSDPAVMSLVTNTHVPVEVATSGPPPPNPQVMTMRCDKCFNNWPCPTTLDLRTYMQAHNLPVVAQPPLQNPVPPTSPPFAPRR